MINYHHLVRIVIGAWCIFILVLLNTYNGTLISFVTATPRARPLVSSLQGLMDERDIHLVVDRGYGHDVVISVRLK